MLFEIDDAHELRALHRVLLEAKFHDAPDDAAIAGSPIVAALANRVVDALAMIDARAGKADAWGGWRRSATATSRPWAVAVRRASETGGWIAWARDKKEAYARILLSPFVPDANALARFVDEVDAGHRAER
jgi:hypothetical protein